MTTLASGVRASWRSPTVAPERPRILLGLIILAAAMPVRLAIPFFRSMSVLDIVLGVAAFTLVLDLPYRRLRTGPAPVLVLLSVPVFAAVMSLAWSQDQRATLSVVTFTVESLIAYLIVLRELEGLPAQRIVGLIGRFVVLLVIPAVLLLLRVPGFQPEQSGLSVTSGNYLSYYTRLSHPILGRSNNLATVLVVFVPVLLWWGHVHRRRWITASGMIGVAAILATQSRGVGVASIAGLVIYALVRPRAVKRGRPFVGKVLAAAAVLGGLAVAFYELNPLTKEFAAGRLAGENLFLREDLVKVALDHIRERPLLGFGPGVVPDGDVRLTVDVHNTYVQQMMSFGVVMGGLVGLALLALPLVVWLRARLVPVAGVIGLGLAIEMLSFVFESSFEGTVLRVIFYLSVGLLIGLLEACADEESGGAPQRPSAARADAVTRTR